MLNFLLEIPNSSTRLPKNGRGITEHRFAILSICPIWQILSGLYPWGFYELPLQRSDGTGAHRKVQIIWIGQKKCSAGCAVHAYNVFGLRRAGKNWKGCPSANAGQQPLHDDGNRCQPVLLFPDWLMVLKINSRIQADVFGLQ